MLLPWYNSKNSCVVDKQISDVISTWERFSRNLYLMYLIKTLLFITLCLLMQDPGNTVVYCGSFPLNKSKTKPANYFCSLGNYTVPNREISEEQLQRVASQNTVPMCILLCKYGCLNHRHSKMSVFKNQDLGCNLCSLE